MDSIGLIGLGLVGSALAEVLHKQGLVTVGYDIRPEQYTELARFGLQVAASPREVARKCNRIILSLPDSDVSRTVIEGPEGLLPALRPGSVIIDSTTGDPQAMAALASRLADRQIHYLDVTLGGSSDELRRQEVVLMAGGDREAYAECEPLLCLLTDRVFYMGESGKGAEAKLIYNLVLGLHRAVLAEALSLGESADIDLEQLLQLLRAGSTYSFVMDNKGEKMLQRDFAPVARLRQHQKDVQLMLQMAHRLNVSLPLTTIHLQLLQRGVEEGIGDWDNAAIFEVYLRLKATDSNVS